MSHVPQSSSVSAEQTPLVVAADPVDFSRLGRREGVCGGVVCIRETRVPVWVLERCRQMRLSIPQILEDYPFLDQQDVVAAWRYAETHPEEILRDIQENGE